MLDKIFYIWYNIVVKQKGVQVKMFLVKIYAKDSDILQRIVGARNKGELREILVNKVDHTKERAVPLKRKIFQKN